MMWHTFMHDLFYVFIEQTSNSFFNLRNNSNLPLKYPQVQWELCIGGRCSHSQAKFHWLFFFSFLFCFRTWFHWGWGVKLSPKIWDCSWYDTSRRLIAPDIFIDFYELKYLWICHFSVFLLFFFLPFSFIFCAHFSLPKIYSFSKYLAFTLPELCVVRMQTWIFVGHFILLFLASLSMIVLPVQESSSTSFCLFPITSKSPEWRKKILAQSIQFRQLSSQF